MKKENFVRDNFGVDAVVLLHGDNRFYFAGLQTSFGAMILSDKGNVYITDGRYAIYAKENAKDCSVLILEQGQDFYKLLLQNLQALGAKTVGYEQDSILKASFDKLEKALSGLELKPLGKELDIVRAIKSQSMVEDMAKAQKIAESALATVQKQLKVGISEKDVATQLLFEMLKLGASGLSFDTIVCFGDNSAKPHHQPSDRILQENDIILIDMGAKYKGVCSDMTRTFSIGKVDKKLEDIHSAVLQAQELAISKIKCGMSCKEVDAIARECLQNSGYGQYFTHSLGHGVGVAIHENPRLSTMSAEILQEGMIVTIEPGVYIEGIGGVRIEDMLFIKKDSVQNLTNFNKNLYSVSKN